MSEDVPGPDEIWGPGCLRGVKEVRQCEERGLISHKEARRLIIQLGWPLDGEDKPRIAMQAIDLDELRPVNIEEEEDDYGG